ncbi:MAG: peptidase [Gammaproteobacteria bacterium]|nr:peptidase [Gammaproteobacteria bacterium]
MTYCVGICVRSGLVFASDSRTNAGVDSVSEYSKMYSFGVPGERQFTICTAGNLATTQGVIAQIERDIRNEVETNLMTVRSVADAATYVGALSVAQQEKHTGGGPVFEASFLLGGEVLGSKCRLLMIYPAGNYIESSAQTPYLQVGESKYGKPILDRVITTSTPLEEAALCALVSMESTIRSNLTVGPPVELQVYQAGGLLPGQYTSFTADSTYWRKLKKSWNAELRSAFSRLPPVDWLERDSS